MRTKYKYNARGRRIAEKEMSARIVLFIVCLIFAAAFLFAYWK